MVRKQSRWGSKKVMNEFPQGPTTTSIFTTSSSIQKWLWPGLFKIYWKRRIFPPFPWKQWSSPQKFWYPPLPPAINNDTVTDQATVKCSISSFIANAVCSKLAFNGRYWLLSIWLEGVVVHTKKQCTNYLLQFGNQLSLEFEATTSILRFIFL